MFPVSRMLLKSGQDANLIFDVKCPGFHDSACHGNPGVRAASLFLPVASPIYLYTPCALVRGGCHRSLNLHPHLKSLHNDD